MPYVSLSYPASTPEDEVFLSLLRDERNLLRASALRLRVMNVVFKLSFNYRQR
jgi:hypothetical protein